MATRKYIFVCVLFASLCGCSSVQPQTSHANLQDRIRTAYRNAPQPLANGPYGRQYERGWKQAYFDFSRGSDRQLPSVPPGAYRLDRCSDGTEMRRISAWYRGYEAGLLAAGCNCPGGLTEGNVCRPEPPVRGGGADIDSTVAGKTQPKSIESMSFGRPAADSSEQQTVRRVAAGDSSRPNQSRMTPGQFRR